MIDRVRTKVQRIDAQTVSLSVGAIDCVLQVPNAHSFADGADTPVYIHMHWNQDNGPSFYGFASAAERQVFRLLISCQGVGPKVGLAALAELGADGFVCAVHSEDERAISRVSGIGPKRAEQLVVQLRTKVAALVKAGVIETGPQAGLPLQPLREALESLSYSRVEISRAIDHVKKKESVDPTFDQLMRQALSFLSQQS